MVGGLLIKTGSTVWAPGVFYKAIVKSVLLYGRKSRVVADSTIKVIE